MLGHSGILTSRLWFSLARALPWQTITGLVGQINALATRFSSLSAEELRRCSLSLRYRALSGEALSRLLPEAYALVREATDRALGMRHYNVQVLGGVAMHFGAIAEMQTGEGKTLTAMLPLFLAALEGQGAHLATANDYLANRDADIIRPALELLGLTVAAIDTTTPRTQRRHAYHSDITYAAAREFGFDFLRDRLLVGPGAEYSASPLARMSGDAEGPSNSAVQRGLHFCLVDEADSILIDEARTPLIVSTLGGDSAESASYLFSWAAAATDAFRYPEDFEQDPRHKIVTLTPQGRRKVRELPKPDMLAAVGMLDLYEHVERALLVEREYQCERHYVVQQGKVVIVDEFTGRIADGRKWRDGIHQAIEAKEALRISSPSGDAARITVQDFFLRYQRLAGMTGTAAQSARELRRIYRLRVRVIPTHRPCRRRSLPDRVFGNSDAKWRAVVDEIQSLHAQGRPVLVGTRSIDKSEHLSRLLVAADISHEVLNAHRHAEEAEIVARAGERGTVTVATNMAGRGTDIKLGEGVAECGGLHVICTELHESARVDRQLIGRCARQGDPGSFRQYMALDDDILSSGLGRQLAERWRQRGGHRDELPAGWGRLLRKAQRRAEREHYRQRRRLLYHAQQRRQVQNQLGQDPFLDAGA